MKAEELMIGDWVFTRGKIEQVTSIYDGYICTEHYEDSHDYYFDPIPITPEILEKNGFERRDDLVERMEDPLQFIYEDKETTESVSVGWVDSYDNGLRDENAEYLEEYWKIWIDAFDASYEKTARILYVHELQHALRLCGIKKEIVL